MLLVVISVASCRFLSLWICKRQRGVWLSLQVLGLLQYINAVISLGSLHPSSSNTYHSKRGLHLWLVVIGIPYEAVCCWTERSLWTSPSYLHLDKSKTAWEIWLMRSYPRHSCFIWEFVESSHLSGSFNNLAPCQCTGLVREPVRR